MENGLRGRGGIQFAYVLPQVAGKPIVLVIPMPLQMGWVESPLYFCAATKTARDITTNYSDYPVGNLPPHKFVNPVKGDKEFEALPSTLNDPQRCQYCLEVYVDNFMNIVIPTSKDLLEHVATAVMTGIHNVFPANIIDSNDPIFEKKLVKKEGQYALFKTLLRFEFISNRKTMWPEEEKQPKLLTTLRSWIRVGSLRQRVLFKEFESVVQKVRHAFTALPGGRGLLSSYNRLVNRRPR